MGLEKLFSKKDYSSLDHGEEYLEVNVSDGVSPGITPRDLGKVGIVIEKLSEFSDSDRVLRQIREGNVVFLKIKDLKDKDIGELKRAVEKMKKTVIASNGEIVGVEQDWLVLTPAHAIVHR